MQYRLRLASGTFILVAASAAAGACGHLPFDELPETADASSDATTSGGPFLDGSSSGDVIVQGDGSVDAKPPRDGGDKEDARFDLDGAPDAACSVTGDCHVIYVSPILGKKDNPGTSDRPVDSIDNALDLVTDKRNELHVASGDYKGPIKITMDQDVRIFGGFQCKPSNCTWGRDAQETVVTANDLGGGALLINEAHGRGTIISDLHLKGAQGSIDPTSTLGAVTVLISGGTPTLQNLTIEGPLSKGGSAGNAKRTAAVMIRGKQDDPRGVLIDNCTILGGTADGIAAGVLVEDGLTTLPATAQPALELSKSNVTGGSAPSTSAVLLLSAGALTKLHDNVKLQAAVATPQGNTTDSWAITVTGTVDISKNQINPTNLNNDYCKNSQLCGGIHVLNATATIRNNVVHGVPASISTAVLLEMSDGAHPLVILNSNVLEGGGHGGTDGSSSAIFVKNKNASDGTIGLVRNNILLGGKNLKDYGVYELDDNAVSGHLTALDHNDVRAETAAYHAWFGASSQTSKDYALIDLKNAPFANATDSSTTNIGDDCLLDPTWHLLQHSKCINAGTKVEAPADDIDGDPRPFPANDPANYDIGADESKFASP